MSEKGDSSSSKNDSSLLSATFTVKFELIFVVTLENAFSLRFYFKARTLIFPKKGTRDFKNSPPFERSACFYVTINDNALH